MRDDPGGTRHRTRRETSARSSKNVTWETVVSETMIRSATTVTSDDLELLREHEPIRDVRGRFLFRSRHDLESKPSADRIAAIGLVVGRGRRALLEEPHLER